MVRYIWLALNLMVFENVIKHVLSCLKNLLTLLFVIRTIRPNKIPFMVKLNLIILPTIIDRALLL